MEKRDFPLFFQALALRQMLWVTVLPDRTPNGDNLASGPAAVDKHALVQELSPRLSFDRCQISCDAPISP